MYHKDGRQVELADGSVVAVCTTENAANFIAAALEDYDGVTFYELEGNYTVVDNKGSFAVKNVNRGHDICQCQDRNIAHYVAAIYNSVLS